MRETAAASSTLRFTKKREAIIAAATEVLNKQGVKGMTLAEVAGLVGLNTTSVTYYFRKKEDLAAACFLAGIERMSEIIALAAREADAAARIGALVGLYLERHARQRASEEAPLPIFLDIPTLDEPHFSVVRDAFGAMVREARALFAGVELERKELHMRTRLTLEQVLWTPVWLIRFDVEDFPRVTARMTDILVHGYQPASAPWPPAPLAAQGKAAEPRDVARETFLTASTRLINRLGYRGASVEKISAELNVTKGSFYHHNEAKDELVLACFERTDAVFRSVQRAAAESDGAAGVRLARAAASLAAFQLSDAAPLLRTTALGALPDPLRMPVIERALRTTERFAGMIADGVADGSLRPVDPMIGAQMLKIALNSMAEAPVWDRSFTSNEGVDLVLKPILCGALS